MSALDKVIGNLSYFFHVILYLNINDEDWEANKRASGKFEKADFQTPNSSLPSKSSILSFGSEALGDVKDAAVRSPAAVKSVVHKFAPLMSRPWVLVFLFLMIVFVSQFEWKQQFGNEVDPKPSSSSREQIAHRVEVVKEKVILSQERNIRKLEELVRTLRQQLQYCRGDNLNGTSMQLDKIFTEMDRMSTLED